MPYRNDGSSHTDGIANEVTNVAYFNANSNCNINKRLRGHEEVSLEWEKRGGTQQKADAVCMHSDGRLDQISIKNHKKNTSTFDLENTSMVTPLFPTIKTDMTDFKTKYTGATNVTPTIRGESNTLFSTALDNCTSEHLKAHMERVYEKSMACPYIIVRNEPKRQFQMIRTENLRHLLLLGQGSMFILKKGRGKTSRQIWTRDLVGNEVNTSLRIRLVLNNGVGALLGLSEKNKSSVPSIKIQLDKVDSFVSQCEDLVVDSY
jgi:hypothetical protein